MVGYDQWNQSLWIRRASLFDGWETLKVVESAIIACMGIQSTLKIMMESRNLQVGLVSSHFFFRCRQVIQPDRVRLYPDLRYRVQMGLL